MALWLGMQQEVLSLNPHTHIKEKLCMAVHACHPSIEEGGVRILRAGYPASLSRRQNFLFGKRPFSQR